MSASFRAAIAYANSTRESTRLDTDPLSPGPHSVSNCYNRLIYTIFGTGPSLVICQVSGWGIGPSYLSDGLAPLHDFFKILYFTPRGTPPSSRPIDTLEMSSKHMVEDHEILRRYLKLGSMFLMGHSNGDSIVLGYAQRYPSHVEKLVLHDHELQGFDDKWHATHPVNIMELERFELFSTDTNNGWFCGVRNLSPPPPRKQPRLGCGDKDLLVPSAEIEKAWGCKLQQLVIPFNTATATATAMSHVKVLFGAASFGSLPTETSQEFLDLLKKHNVKDLDTAYLYEGSERALKELGATSSFTIHTKAPGFVKDSGTKASILAGAKKSFEDLGVKSVESYFLHSPDPDTPIEQTVDGMQLVYASGKYRHFGLSNFKPEDVKKVYDYAQSKGYVLPTVFQGNYNPVARHYDTTLFPLLRELKIAFYAYSPLAGGFLVKEAQTLSTGAGRGRWDPTSRIGKLYNDKYSRPSLLEALSEWESIAKEARVSKAALAYRWVMYNSKLSAEHGDGIIIGASRGSQLEETLRAIEDGPLDENIAKRVDKVWELVKDEAPIDNYHV